MNVLLVNVPSRRGASGFWLPLGLLYVGRTFENHGHKVKLVDPYLGDVQLRNFTPTILDSTIETFKPTIIGYGGIATSYGRTKQLSLHIRHKYQNIIQIAGGNLTSVHKLLNMNTGVHAVLHGEAEKAIPQLLEDIYRGELFENYENSQLKNIDLAPYPAYHLVDLKRYLIPVDPRKYGLHKPLIPMITSRGCLYKCSFCYRHLEGYRQHSVKYVIDHIKHVKDTYGITGFLFGDELFNSNRRWVLNFCNALNWNDLKIHYIIGGARVDRVDELMLRRLKDTGCLNIQFGQESGSNLILKEYRKGVNVKQNIEATKLTKKMGLSSGVQLVIGSPSETTSTIRETIQFMKDVGVQKYSLNYLIPLPGAPIWKYVEEHDLVDDVEKYLDGVAEYGGRHLINLTGVSNRVWRNWTILIYAEMRKHGFHMANRKLGYIMFSLLSLVALRLPLWLRRRKN